MTDNRLSSNSSLSKPQMRHIVNNLSGQGVDQEVEGWGNEHGGPSDAMNYGLYQYGKMTATSIMNDSLQGLQASAQMSQETLEHYEETGSSELSEGEYMQEADIGKSDGGSDSTKARRTTFIETLYQMVHTPENAPAIGFADDGVSLEVRNTNFFSSNVLPNHFKHRNVSSFIRQLNNYGFRTIPSAKGVFQTFVHDNFRKDRKDLIRFIMRRTSHVVKKKKTLYEQVMELKQRDAERRQHIEQLEAMDLQKCMYIQDLEQRNRILMEERDAALIENQRLIRLVNSQAPGLLKDGPKGGGRNQPSPPPRNTGQYAASSTMASGPRDLQQQQQQQQHHIPPPPPPSFPMASGGTPFHTSFYPPMQLPTSSASSPTSMSGAGGFPALTSQQPFAGQSGGAGRGRSNSGGAGTYWS